MNTFSNYYKRRVNYIKNKFKARRPTRPEKMFMGIRKSIGLQYQREHCICGKYYDFYLPKQDMLVEIDGKYYHGKGLRVNQKNRMQLKNAANDLLKSELAKRCGKKLIRIWQGSVTKNKVMELLTENA